MTVGVLSVIFLKRRLFGFQWMSLVCVMLGVALVGLAGTLVKQKVEEEEGGDVIGSLAMENGDRESPTAVAAGVLIILLAQGECFFVDTAREV